VTSDRNRQGFVLAALVVAASFAGAAFPLHAQLFGGDDTARRQIAEQAKRVDALKQQNDESAARLARIEDALKSLSATNPALELVQQLEMLRQELKQMRGQMEVLGNDVQMAAKRQRDMYVDLDTRLKRFEQPPAAAGATPPAAAAPATAGAPSGTAAAPPAVPGTAPPGAAPAAPATIAVAPAATAPQPAEANAYEAAQGQRRIGNYQGAIAAFQNFIAQYPKSTLAPRAQYWIGDSHYNLRDFKSAMSSQQKLIATYPDSATIPDALLNIASCQLELGDAVGARKTMDGLVTRYPTTEAAEKARRRLATLR
jgi:tol-pal system protein YbgF